MRSVKFFLPKYRLGHPENCLFLLSIKNVGSKYQKYILFNFGKNFTGCDSVVKGIHVLCIESYLSIPVHIRLVLSFMEYV